MVGSYVPTEAQQLSQNVVFEQDEAGVPSDTRRIILLFQIKCYGICGLESMVQQIGRQDHQTSSHKKISTRPRSGLSKVL